MASLHVLWHLLVAKLFFDSAAYTQYVQHWLGIIFKAELVWHVYYGNLIYLQNSEISAHILLAALQHISPLLLLLVCGVCNRR